MVDKTLLVFGPGGIEKSPFDDIRHDVSRGVPFLMREGPRDGDENRGIPDFLYANPKLCPGLTSIFQNFGATMETLSTKPCVGSFPKRRGCSLACESRPGRD